MHAGVKLEAFLLRVVDAIAYDYHRGGEDFKMLRVAAGGFGAALDVGVEFFCAGEVAGGAEDCLCCFGGELAAGFGLACLHYYGPALDLFH